MNKIHALESVRGFAAVYVLLGHFFINRFSLGKFDLFFRFGQEAVMLFFLLSGFVIYYSFQKQPEQPFRDYFRRRFVRIYPIFIVSLFISFLVLCLSRKMLAPFGVTQFLGNLFMMQDFSSGKPGVWFSTFNGNLPLWSLSYEWWFYMMFFPIVTLVEEDKQCWVVSSLALIGFLSYVKFPNQIGLFLNYFIIWWLGVEVAKIYAQGQKPTLSKLKTPLMLLTFFVLLHAANIIFNVKVLHVHPSFGIHPILEFRHFAFSLLVLLIALSMTRSSWAIANKILFPFSFLAPISYALYVLHYPLAVSGDYLTFVNSTLLRNILYLIITFVIAYVAEVPLQRLINQKFKNPAKVRV